MFQLSSLQRRACLPVETLGNTMVRTIIVGWMLCLLAVGANAAAPKWMNNGALRQAFSGQAIEGHYRDGRMFVETYGSDHRLEYVEGSRTQTGYWTIVAGTFCTIYEGILSGGCFRVHQLSVNCYEFYFQARNERSAADIEKRRKPSWTARAWRRNAVSTCQERPTV